MADIRGHYSPEIRSWLVAPVPPEDLRHHEDLDGEAHHRRPRHRSLRALAVVSRPLGLQHGLWFSWVSPLMATGARKQLQLRDLLVLDPEMQPAACCDNLWLQWVRELQKHPPGCGRGRASFLRALVRTYGRPYFALAALKLGNDALGFAAPLLLKLLVEWLSATSLARSPSGHKSSHDTAGVATADAELMGTAPQGSSGASSSGGDYGGSGTMPWWWDVLSPDGAYFGCTAALALGASCLLRALLNSHYNWGLGRLNCQLRAGLMCLLYKKALLAGPVGCDAAGAWVAQQQQHQRGPGAAKPSSNPQAAAETKPAETQGTEAEVATLMSVDAGRLVNLLVSFHELWSLPLQMSVALYLLYLQVRYAFIAGLLLCFLLIPVNRWIAQGILEASKSMMAHKDQRIRLTGEMLRGIRAVKMLAWEGVFVSKIKAARTAELRGLAVRKYLDALCVYLWAVTGQLFSALTFGLMAYGGVGLSPGAAFASIALFQNLITPLNAFPWVVNGIVEAMVSLRRVEAYLLQGELKPQWAYEQADDDQQHQHHQHHGGGGGGASGGVGGGDAAWFGRRASSVSGQSQQQQPDWTADGRGLGGAAHHQRQLSSGSGLGEPLLWGWGSHGGQGDDDLSFPMPASRALQPQQRQQQRRQQQHLQQHANGGGDSAYTALTTPLLPPSTIGTNEREPALKLLPMFPECSALLSEATYAWAPGATPCLSKVNCVIPRATLTVVVGKVGAGKSSLLAALAGEVQALSGRCETESTHIGYVPQSPWIMTGSFRDNVLLGDAMDEAWYGQVLFACALLPDLESLHAGDLTHVGDRGAALSGGQKARLALARAVYHRCSLYLLDDVLAAVDNTSAAHIIHHLLLSPTMLGLSPPEPPAPNKAAARPVAPLASAVGGGQAAGVGGVTVVLVTKSRRCIDAAGLVLHLHKGRIAFRGSPADYWALHAARSGARQHQQQQAADEGAGPAPQAAGGLEKAGTPTIGGLAAAVAAAGAAAGGDGSAGPSAPPPPAGDRPPTAGGGSSAPSAGAHHRPHHSRVESDMSNLSISPSPGTGIPGMPSTSTTITTSAALKPSATFARRPPSPSASFNSTIFTWLPASPAAAAGAVGSKRGGGSHEAAAWAGFRGRASGGQGTAGGGAGEEWRPPRWRQSQSAGLFGFGDEDEEREVGHVKWRVYSAYGASVGWVTVALVVATLLLMQATKNANDVWISIWVASQQTSSEMGPWSDPAMQQQQGVAAPDAGSDLADTAALAAWLASSSLQPAMTVAPRPLLPWFGFSPAPPASGDLPFHATPAWHGPSTTALSSPSSTSASLTAWAWAASAAQSLQHWSLQLLHPSPDSPHVTSHHPPPRPPPPSSSLPASTFLRVLLLLSALNSLFTLGRAFSFAFAGLRAARRTHDKLLDAVLKATIAFFNSVPSGRIVNRFSSDMAKADDTLPFILNILLAHSASLLGLLLVMCITSPSLLLLLLPLGLIYRHLQLYYRQTSREIRRLDSVTLSPVYGVFGEVRDAAPCLRGLSLQRRFLRAQERLVSAYQRAAVSGAAAGVWLGLRLQLLAAMLVTCVGGLAVATAWGFLPGGSALSSSLAGLSLAYALPIVGVLDGLLTSSAETEQEMVAVERIMQYLRITPQQDVLLAPAASGSLRGAPSGSGAAPSADPSVGHPLRGGRASFSSLGGASPPTSGGLGAGGAGGGGIVRGNTGPVYLGSDPIALSPHTGRAVSPFRSRGAGVGIGSSGMLASPPPPPVLQLMDVYMRYGPSLPFALAGLSLSVAPGERLGVVGRSGAGKSSLVAVLLRLVEIDQGAILLRGTDVRAMPLVRLRTSFGVVPQTPLLLSGSIRENLDPGGRYASDPGEIARALRSVGLWGWLEAAARTQQQALLEAQQMQVLSTRSSGTYQEPAGSPATQAPQGSMGPLDATDCPIGAGATDGIVGSGAVAASTVASAAGTGSGGTSGASALVSLRDLMVEQRRAIQRERMASSPSAVWSGWGMAAAAGGGPGGAAGDGSGISVRAGTPSTRRLQELIVQGHGWFDNPDSPMGSFAGSILPLFGGGAAQRQRSTSADGDALGGGSGGGAAVAGGSVFVSPVAAAMAALAVRGKTAGAADDPAMLRAVLGLRVGGGGGSGGAGNDSASSPSTDAGGACATSGPQLGHVSLSAGQQQLLCLARMLLQQRPIVLLDEASAAVDPGTAAVMRGVLDEQLRGRTVLQVAHDLSAVLGYDRVAVMEEGMVVEVGAPAELLRVAGGKLAALAAAAGAGAAMA